MNVRLWEGFHSVIFLSIYLQQVSREFKSTLEKEIGLDEVSGSTQRTDTYKTNTTSSPSSSIRPEASNTTADPSEWLEFLKSRFLLWRRHWLPWLMRSWFIYSITFRNLSLALVWVWKNNVLEHELMLDERVNGVKQATRKPLTHCSISYINHVGCACLIHCISISVGNSCTQQVFCFFLALLSLEILNDALCV